jgi:Type I phosphodiesterase / nucleotide pyrophosphatase
VLGQPSVAALVRECRRPGLPGIMPSRQHSLAAVPDLLLGELARAPGGGVIVLGVDGLSHRAAASAWSRAELTYLTSTFPSTSAPAWLTALTGADPQVHGVPGMVYRVGGALAYAVTGQSIAGDGAVPLGAVPPGAVLPQPTVFERAAAAGHRCVAVGRELGHLPGPWAPALLRGAAPVTAVARTREELAAQAADPGLLADAVAADVTMALSGSPTLVWVYVNLDDHVHAHGYDAAVMTALRRLGHAAAGWAGEGWTVVAHSDHGQVPVRADPALARAWADVDDPRECELPGGGAGRVRWLYPRPGREAAVRARLADALGASAVVVPAHDLGLRPGRVGSVVAIAADERFPLPDPTLRFEHGGLDPDEMIIPVAVWRPHSG